MIGDVDRFKEINDTHGHAAGDAVLEAIAARIRSCLRTFESAYRIGGEEFADPAQRRRGRRGGRGRRAPAPGAARASRSTTCA